MKVFTSILNREPDNHKVQNNIGVILADQDRTEEAAQYFSQALKLDPEYKKARLNLKRIMMLKANSPTSLAAGDEILENTFQPFDVADMILMADQDAESLEIPFEPFLSEIVVSRAVSEASVQTEKTMVWDFKDIEKPAMLKLLKYLADLAEYFPSEAQKKNH